MSAKVSIINGLKPDPGSGLGGANEGYIQGFQDDVTDIQLGGVRDLAGGDALVTQVSPTPIMSVSIADGVVYVPNDNYDAYDIDTTKAWRVALINEADLVIAANSSGSTRIDLVAVKLDKVTVPNEYASNVASIVRIAGTPGAGAPPLPVKHYKLAQITVVNGATSILTASIADSRRQINLKGASNPGSLTLGATTVTSILDEDTMVSDSAAALATQQSVKAYVDNSILAIGGKNLLINGGMTVSQRGTLFESTGGANNDDKYVADRWNLLSDGNDIVDVTQGILVGPPDKWALKLQVETINKRFGILQIIEARSSLRLQGRQVSLSFDAKTNGTEIANVRAFVLSWDGSMDAVTSDIISAWGSSGSDPTFVANWTKENTGSNLALTSSWQRFTIENISVNTANMANLAVFIMVNDTDGAIDDDLYITDIMLNEGAEAQPFETVPFDVELSRCERYYEKSFNYATAPGDNIAPGEVVVACATGNFGTSFGSFVAFHARKLKAPTIKYYSSVSDKWIWYTGGIGSAQTVISNNIGENGFAPTSTASDAYTMAIGSYVADAEL